jgi:hypothetical protein
VSAFNASGGIFYVDSVNGSDANNGTTPSTPKKSFNQIDNLASYTNCRFRLAQGSHWKTSLGANQFLNGTFGNDRMRLDSYVGIGGAGPDPIIEIDTAVASAPWRFNNLSRDLTDLVVSNIHGIIGPTATTTINQYTTVSSAHLYENVYFDNCIFENRQNAGGTYYGGCAIASGNPGNNIGFWFTLPYQAYGNAGTLTSAANSWWFVMGGSHTQPGINTGPSDDQIFFEVRSHYFYNSSLNHTLYRWLNFLPITNPGTYLSGNLHIGATNYHTVLTNGGVGGDGTNITNTVLTVGSGGVSLPGTNFEVGQRLITANVAGGYSGHLVVWDDNVTITSIISTGAVNTWIGAQLQLSGNAVDQTSSDYIAIQQPILESKWYCIDGCHFQGSDYGIAMWTLPGGPNPGYTIQIINYVAQNCTFQGQNGAFGSGVTPACTIRDCTQWGALYHSAGYVPQGWFAGTGNYKDPDSARLNLRIYRNKIYNNIGVADVFYSGTGSSCPLQFTDNEVWDNRTGDVNKGVMRITPGLHTGSFLDRNKYYGPNYANSKPFIDATVAPGTLKTFAEWQAFGYDPNSVVQQPSWPDPANGNFG